jgi:uncharacterized membrane protein YozB (DUF420 family)
MSTVTTGGSTAVVRRQRGDHIFYSGMALAVAVAVFIGFVRTFYLRSQFTDSSLPLYLQVHGALFTAWVVLFVAQVALVASGNTQTHRRLGWAGGALAAMMVVAGTSAGILSMRLQVELGNGDAAMAFLTTPLFSMTVFAMLVGAAVVWRRHPETHKRLMLLATLSLLDAAVARWPMTISGDLMLYTLTNLFIVAAIVYDAGSRRSVSPVYMWGGLLIVAGQWLRTAVGQTEAWQAFASVILQ